MLRRRPPVAVRILLAGLAGAGVFLAGGAAARVFDLSAPFSWWVVFSALVASGSSAVGAAVVRGSGRERPSAPDSMGIPPGSPEEVVALVRRGQTAEAAARYRELVPGTGPAFAEDAVYLIARAIRGEAAPPDQGTHPSGAGKAAS